MKYDYLIVGAGLFGAVIADKAKQAGKKCLVIDKREHIAGNIYTEKVDGIDFHKYGAHIFHTSDKEVWDYVNSITEFNNFINCPMARYKDEIYNLPFNMNTFSKMWGIKTPQEAVDMIEKQKRESGITDPQNLEEQGISLIGKDVYNKLIKGYTEKQWGRRATELPAFIIKRLPVRLTYDNNYFNDKYQGIPVEGYTKLIEKMFDGTEIKLGCDYFANKEEYDNMADKIIFTGMIDEYYDYKFGTLEYRSLRFESETLDVENYQGVAVTNYTEYEVPYTRIIEHKHFNFAKTDKSIITKEYPANWNKGDEPYYPINNDTNDNLYAKYKELSEKENKVIFGGRLGMYKYYDMDDTIMAAFELAKKLFN